jgi:hypothetical protein
VEAVDQVFGANKVEIKQKTLEALRLLRQADHPLDEIRKTLADRTENIRSAKQDDNYGASNIVLPYPGS